MTPHSTSASIDAYHDKARAIPRFIHPFMNVHEVLTFGLAYKEQDFDWDTGDGDKNDAESEEGVEDDEESPKAIRYVLLHSMHASLIKTPCPVRAS